MADTWNDEADRQMLGPQRSSARLIGMFATLAIVLAMAMIVRQWISRGPATKAAAVGKSLDVLELVPLEGVGDSITADDLRGKVTLINFWGPWCPPCRMEFPELMQLRERLSAEARFQFLSVTCWHDANERELVGQTKQFLTGQKYELPVYRDPQLVTRRAILTLNEDDGFAYPTTVLVDQQGIVQGVWIGYSPGVGEQMRRSISSLLAQQQETAP